MTRVPQVENHCCTIQYMDIRTELLLHYRQFFLLVVGLYSYLITCLRVGMQRNIMSFCF